MKLPKGIETSLLAPLKNVQKLLDDNNRSNNNAACGKLDAFLNRVEVMEANDHLSSNQAASLEAAAGELRDHAPIC